MAWEEFDRDPTYDEYKRLEKMATAAPCDEQGEEDRTIATNIAEDNKKRVAKGRHYIVFAFQNWSGKHKSIHFVAARYALAKVNSRWICKASRHGIAVLASFHIYVTGLVYDGA